MVPSLVVESRVEDLLARMTLEEKLSLLAGTGFDTAPIPRLGIPALHMTDGPAGIRTGPATSFPAGVARRRPPRAHDARREVVAARWHRVRHRAHPSTRHPRAAHDRRPGRHPHGPGHFLPRR